jgi:hypothetical protein
LRSLKVPFTVKAGADFRFETGIAAPEYARFSCGGIICIINQWRLRDAVNIYQKSAFFNGPGVGLLVFAVCG